MIEPPPEALDIGGGHRITFAEYEGEVAGINDWHLKSDGEWCVGWVSFKGAAWHRSMPQTAGWDVIQREPLTLSPSLLCRGCGSHGFIQNGRWVPA